MADKWTDPTTPAGRALNALKHGVPMASETVDTGREAVHSHFLRLQGISIIAEDRGDEESARAALTAAEMLRELHRQRDAMSDEKDLALEALEEADEHARAMTEKVVEAERRVEAAEARANAVERQRDELREALEMAERALYTLGITGGAPVRREILAALARCSTKEGGRGGE